MAEDMGDVMLTAEARQDSDRLAHPQDQGGPQTGQIGAQVRQRLGRVVPLAGRSVRERPIVRLDNIKRQDAAQPRRAGQRGVVMGAQIAFEPDKNIHGT